MKISKFLFISIIFLVSLLCISAVSAADDAASDIISNVNEQAVLDESIVDADIQESEDDENVLSDDGEGWSQPSVDPPSVGDFVLLNKTVNNGSDVVDLKYNYNYEPSIEGDLDLQNGINITQDVTINGHGHTISGCTQAHIFYIPADVSVVLKNIKFMDAYTPEVGGAVYAEGLVTFENCTFENCFSAKSGGAVVSENRDGIAINCTFRDNHADWDGGAVYRVKSIDCTFTNNSAGKRGGGIFDANATNCIFTGNYAGESAGAMCGRLALNCTFRGNHAANGGAMGDGRAINCTFTGNYAEGYGGATYYNDVSNCTFTQNNATTGGALGFSDAINCTFTKNIASEAGGAIYSGYAINSTFTQNSAENAGGAICDGMAINCTFKSNTATGSGCQGGAIVASNATNCTFTNNIASWGGAMSYGNATNCTFTGNRAWWVGGALSEPDTIINCNFTNNTAAEEGGAIYSASEVKNSNFIGNSAGYGGAISGTPYVENCTFISNSAYRGGAINSASEIKNCTFILNAAIEEGTNDICYGQNDTCNFIIPDLSASNFKTTYNYGEKFNFKIATADQTFNGIKTVISIYKNGAFVANYTALSGQGWIVKLGAGTYTAVININGSNVAPITKTITVAKNPTKLTAAAVTAVYNNNKYLIITLKDGKGRALSGIKVTVTLGTAKTYKTNKNGQIKINVGKLVPKTYTAKIKYAGTANYAAATKSVKVVVKKATPKLTAKAKSFNAKLQTKKYVVTFKNNKGKVMKKAKLTLTIGKKTYKATTNAKGKATFKITQLSKKGKYTAVIKYAGNKYYKKLTKKAKITIK